IRQAWRGTTTDDATKEIDGRRSLEPKRGTRDDSRGPPPSHTHGDRRSRDRVGGDETRLPHAIADQPPAHRARAAPRNPFLPPDAQGHAAYGSRSRNDRGRT